MRCSGQLSQSCVQFDILRVVLYQFGESMNFLLISWLSHHFAISVFRLEVDTVDGASISEGLLEIVSGQQLLLE